MLGKRRVDITALFYAHRAETALFQAEYKAEERYKEPEDKLHVLRCYHDMTKREQEVIRERIVNELNSTFKKGDLVRVTNLTDRVWEEIVSFGYASAWWLHEDNGSGMPLVLMLSVEDANERWLPNA